MAEEVEAEIEEEEEECPKCPPVGARHGWQHLLIWPHF